MKTKLIIGVVSLLSLATIFHATSGKKCPMAKYFHHGQSTEKVETAKP